MSRTLSVCLVAISILTLARSASAQVFTEDWENGSTNWVVRNDATNAPIVIQSDATVCSSKYQHETVRVSGGRVFTKAPLVVTHGDTYCLTAWVRGSVATRSPSRSSASTTPTPPATRRAAAPRPIPTSTGSSARAATRRASRATTP